MHFKKMSGVHLPYNSQGLVFFLCKTYEMQPQRIKSKIDRLCHNLGGEYADALFEFLTSDKSAIYISLKYYISESTLYKLRRIFFNMFFEKTPHKKRLKNEDYF